MIRQFARGGWRGGRAWLGGRCLSSLAQANEALGDSVFGWASAPPAPAPRRPSTGPLQYGRIPPTVYEPPPFNGIPLVGKDYNGTLPIHPLEGLTGSQSVINCITLDVTGTCVGYKGKLGNWYTNGAKRLGLPAPDERIIEQTFSRAYDEISEQYPCFGGRDITTKEWWRKVVRRSFDYAGFHYKDEAFEMMFQRIYQRFGSPEMYEAFSDVLPFLRWAKRHGIAVGVITNADERYLDNILPMLGLATDMDFMVASKDLVVEKPHPTIFKEALRRAGDVQPFRALHIGDNYEKDYLGSRAVGMHAILIDRFNQDQTPERRKEGVVVAEDFLEVVEICIRDGLV